MKKTLALLLAVATALLSLFGCSSGAKDDYNVISDLRACGDFRYEENIEGGATIRAYLGSDTIVTIPSDLDGFSVTSIGSYCFRGNEGLTSVILPDTLTTLERDAFRGCPSLSSLTLPASLCKIEQNAFKECSALSEIVLPDGLTYIGSSAFEACTSLKSVIIPGSVLSIGDGAFWKSGLETLTLSEGISEIGDTAFAETPLRTMTFPSSLRVLGWQSFMGCQLESVTLNEGLTTMEGRVFSMNYDLTEIVIPSTVTVVTDRTFSRCSSLTKIKFEGNAPETFFDFDATYGTYIQVADTVFDVYYHEGATGFTSPDWFGYQTHLW